MSIKQEDYRSDQNNYSEAEASIKIDPTAYVKKSINPHKQYDSEGMCVEE